MKLVPVKDVPNGEIFLFQAPDQPMRAWIHLGAITGCPDNEYNNHVWAESYFSYCEYGDSTPRKRDIVSPKPQNHHPVKYLYLRMHQPVLA